MATFIAFAVTVSLVSPKGTLGQSTDGSCNRDQSLLCQKSDCCGESIINNETRDLCPTTCCDLNTTEMCEEKRATKNCLECVGYNRQFCYVSPLWGPSTDMSKCLEKPNDVGVNYCLLWNWRSSPRNKETDCKYNSIDGEGLDVFFIFLIGTGVILALPVFAYCCCGRES
eukprot:m.154344 g.154344  ORF g.154344 m.154344 type:complete len:170 (-) comp30885_c2_seq2:124-633(-)